MKEIVQAAGVKFTITGRGAPVLFVHGGILTTWFDLVLAEPALADAHELITYDRPGYGGSPLSADSLSVADQASSCIALVRHLGYSRVHVVGHSIGACIALQVALDASDAVASLALLEPPVLAALAEPSPTIGVLRESGRLWQNGDKGGALDAFMRGLVDPQYREVLEDRLPDGYGQALRGTDSFFGVDQPSVQSWRFGSAEAARIAQPVLLVIGDRSALVNPMREEIQRRLLEWLPNAESLTVPGATHLLSIQKPRDIAVALASFYRRVDVPASNRRNAKSDPTSVSPQRPGSR